MLLSENVCTDVATKSNVAAKARVTYFSYTFNGEWNDCIMFFCIMLYLVYVPWINSFKFIDNISNIYIFIHGNAEFKLRIPECVSLCETF